MILISSNKLLNSSFDLFHNDPFDISQESASSITYFEVSTRESIYVPELTSHWYTSTKNSKTPTHTSNDSKIDSPPTCYLSGMLKL